MSIPYRLEIFDRSDYSLIDWSLCSIGSPEYDYLTLDTNSVVAIKKVYPDKGDFIKIVASDVTFQGVISDIDQADEKTTTITFKPLESLFDVEVYYNVSAYSGSIENFLKVLIQTARVNSTDAGANLPNVTFDVTTTTAGSLYLESNINNIWTVAITILKKYGITIRTELAGSGITIHIGAVTNSFTVELDLPNVISKNVSLQKDSSTVNSCLIINENNESQQARYYSDDYAAPSVWSIKTIKCEAANFPTESASAASDILDKEEFNNLIEVTIKSDDKIITERTIGATGNVITGELLVPTMLTGIIKTQELTTLIFGVVRLDLSKILLLERRK